MSDETPEIEGMPGEPGAPEPETSDEDVRPEEPATSDEPEAPDAEPAVPDAEAEAPDAEPDIMSHASEPVIEAELVPDDEPESPIVPAREEIGTPAPPAAGSESAAHRSGPGRPRPSAKAIALLAGRTTTGVVVTAVAVVVALGSTFITPPSITSTAPKPIVVTPSPAAQQLVCPGGLLRLADASGADASRVSPLGAPAVAWASDSDATTRNVGTTNAGASGTRSLAEIGTVPPSGDRSAVASGLQSQLLLGETRGLATASCAAPQSDEWLVAGATTLGRTSFVVLTNPSEVEAEVDLEIYGPSGPVAASGTAGIRLAPDEQRVVPLNGLAVDLEAPVVHVMSTGGRIAAAIEQTITRTLVAGGADWSGAQQPSERLVIPGVHVTDANALAPIDVSETDHADITPVVRLLAPLGPAADTTPVTATVAWIPDGSTLADALAARDAESDGSDDQDAGPTDAGTSPSGSAPAPRSMDVALTPGVTSELPVPGLGAGDYTVVVVASTALVGGVRVSTIADAALADPSLAGGVDFAWFEPAASLADEAMIAVPSLSDAPETSPQAAQLGAALWIANPTDSAATVVVTPEGGTPRTIDLAPGTTTHVAITAGHALRLTGVAGLSASVVTRGPGLLAQSPLEAPSPSASAVNVHL